MNQEINMNQKFEIIQEDTMNKKKVTVNQNLIQSKKLLWIKSLLRIYYESRDQYESNVWNY